MGTLLLVRHGQASFGATDYDVLSDTGAEQARLLGRWWARSGVTADLVIHGTQRRQRDTAARIAEAAGWSTALVEEPGWSEFDYEHVVRAVTPGRPLPTEHKAFQDLFEVALERWVAGGHVDDYPETYASFVGRVHAALDRARTSADRGRTVVVVSSGGPIAAVAAHLIDPLADPAALSRAWRRLNVVVVNSSYSRIGVSVNGPRLLTYNEHSHLPPALLTYR
ncbi:MAG: histidine phosphatase family protein [Nocardioides sp.]|uniref:histidine phosphatase family protein n=1 Tax=Nocardioides sp. TaxID=35761 RepID=UPI0039E22B56